MKHTTRRRLQTIENILKQVLLHSIVMAIISIATLYWVFITFRNAGVAQ